MYHFSRNQPEDRSWEKLEVGDRVRIKGMNRWQYGKLTAITDTGDYSVKHDSGITVVYDGDMLVKVPSPVPTQVDEKKEGE